MVDGQRTGQINLIIGFLTGAVLILAFCGVVLFIAYGNNALQAQSSEGVSGGKDSVIVGASPTDVSGYPYVYVLYSREMSDMDKKVLGISKVDKNIKRHTLCLYSTGYTGRGLDLKGVRDITFDLQMVEIPDSQSLHRVAQLQRLYLDMVKKATEAKDK